ncbi:MAG: thioredoxin domain-containing protein [Kiritimatiellae bacterium]|nr:thioredoxin domain-containing protein [Kiritimatiellia bacterium]
MHTNRLIHEKSPYLLQHAHNPVDWYPWGEEAFTDARKENKPIFLSIGYSTCHWCHVMAHESFENAEIARILNEHFVCIKVDREERPDVDRVYMTFVQAATGSGGWPMTVWLTPDLKPFFGGTYFPPQQFAALTNKITGAWKIDRAGIIASSDRVIESLRLAAQPSGGPQNELGNDIREKAFEEIAASFDAQLGGFGSAPKFPRPVTVDFLYRFYAGKPDSKDGLQALEMTLFTLRRMAAGGIHDQLGGGFHRYSVDRFWHVPHFEKMLYDQAQLASAYLTAFQITREPQYEQTARDILDYVLRDMSNPAGGFYSAEDADSLVAHDKPEHAEGAFYDWTTGEIATLLGPERATRFNYRFGVETGGNAPPGSDPRGEFEGRNILIQRHTIAETANQFGQTEKATADALANDCALLLEARKARPRPHRDDKILTAWNGLMISAFARAAQVLDDDGYRSAATRAAIFLRAELYRKKDHTLLRNYRDGASAVEGFAGDYAFLIQGLLDLYETTFDLQWIKWAMELQQRQDELFWDNTDGGYFTTTGKDTTILLRSKEDYDGAEPSPNSIAALNLLRLAQMLDRADWRERAEKTLRAFEPQLERTPSAMPLMLVALDRLHAPPKQIVIAGPRDAPDTQAMLREIHGRFMPDTVVMVVHGGAEQAFFSEQVEFMKNIAPRNGRATAYVCENFACRLPTNDVKEMERLLHREKGGIW